MFRFKKSSRGGHKSVAVALAMSMAVTGIGAAVGMPSVARADIVPLWPSTPAAAETYTVKYSEKAFTQANLKATLKKSLQAPLRTDAALTSAASLLHMGRRKYSASWKKQAGSGCVSDTYKKGEGGWFRFFPNAQFIKTISRAKNKKSGKYVYTAKGQAYDISIHYNKKGVADKYKLVAHKFPAGSKTGVLPPETYHCKTLYKGSNMMKVRTKVNYVK